MSEAREWLVGRALGLVLRWRSRASLVRAALRGRPAVRAPDPSADRTRVGVVQFRLRLVGDAGTYAAALYPPLLEAVEQGAQLVIFPEDVGTCLLGLLPGSKGLARQASNLEQAVASAAGEGARVADVFRLVAPGTRRAYHATFSALARHFGVHIVAGSVRLPNAEGAVENVGTLFGPDGEVIGRQAKTHLFPPELEWGIAAGEEIHVFDTPVGRLALPVCMDHTFFESQRIAWLRGAEILIDPSANPAPYDHWEQLRGVWGRVQESPAYGILACMVGTFMGMTFGGRSGVYAPLEMTARGDGILAQAASPDQQEVVVTDLDLGALRRFRQQHSPVFNLALLERELPDAYAVYRRTERAGRRIVSPSTSG